MIVAGADEQATRRWEPSLSSLEKVEIGQLTRRVLRYRHLLVVEEDLE